MSSLVDRPLLFGVVCLVLMGGMAWAGASLRGRPGSRLQDKDDLVLVVPATLTLLGLIIGFTFSMATARYDQRRLFEEEEANAIGTEYVRADLLPAAEAGPAKQLLRNYLERRIDYYRTAAGPETERLDAETGALQSRLWAAIRPQAAAHPDPVTALVVAGMNDVLNREGYARFSWENRIPASAWWLMVLIALAANGLVGFATLRSRPRAPLLLVLPALVAVSFFLICDIDSPRGGLIRVQPVNLLRLAEALRSGPS